MNFKHLYYFWRVAKEGGAARVSEQIRISLLAELAARRPGLVIAGAPVPVPVAEAAVRSRLERWYQASGLRPRVVAGFDDSALMKDFGRHGSGAFIGTTGTCG